jgi:hypothetical protein
MRADPKLLQGINKLWIRFFVLSVYATMYVRDHARPELYKGLGIDADAFDYRVFEICSEITRQVFPLTLDIDHPAFRKGLERLHEIAKATDAARAQGGPIGGLKRAGLALSGAALFHSRQAECHSRSRSPCSGLVARRADAQLLGPGRLRAVSLVVQHRCDPVSGQAATLDLPMEPARGKPGGAAVALGAVPCARQHQRGWGLCRFYRWCADLGLDGDELLHGLRHRSAQGALPAGLRQLAALLACDPDQSLSRTRHRRGRGADVLDDQGQRQPGREPGPSLSFGGCAGARS